MKVDEKILLKNIGFMVDKNIIIKEERLSNGNINSNLQLINKLNNAIKILEEFIEPKAVYIIKEVAEIDHKKGEILMSDGKRLVSKCLLKVLIELEFLAISVLTCGIKIDEKISSLFSNNEYSLGYLLDEVSSCAVESIASNVEKEIREKAALSNLFISRRYSPGYIDFDLSQQQTIFNIIDPKEVGVTLNESFMMIPRKSISFVVGVSHKKFPDKDGYKMCEICGKKDCTYRRV